MRLSFSTLLLLALVAIGCQSRSQQAAEYNDAIIASQVRIVEAFNSMDSVINEFDEQEIDNSYYILRGRVKEGLKALDTLGVFQGDSTLYLASKHLFLGYDTLVQTHYSELIDLLLLPDSQFTVEEQQKAFNAEARIAAHINTLHAAYEERQLEFGEKFNVVFE
jgi:hypothetical protein